MTKDEIQKAKGMLKRVGRVVTGTVIESGRKGISTDGDGVKEYFGDPVIFYSMEEVEGYVAGRKKG